MVDILFVNQPQFNGIPVPREIGCANPQKDFILQPLGLAYLAGAAREFCSVRLIDANASEKDYNWIGRIIEKEKPKLVIGGFTTPTASHDLYLGKVVHAHSDALFGIWGPLASALKEELRESKYGSDLDFVIDNEPEMTMRELAERLGKMRVGKNLFRPVKGVSYKVNGEWKFNGYRALLKNLDKLPVPAYDLLEMDKYYTPYNRRRPMCIMRTSRGCPARCTFCIIGGSNERERGYGSNWRAYSAGRALKEIEMLVKKFGIREINFFEAEFLISKKRVIDICKGICERGLDVIWNCEARADTVDSEVLGWMKKAGCFGVSYGIESVDENVMEKCKKNISDEQVEEAVKITKEAGIQPALFFMIGLPGETEESIRRNIDFAKKMALKYDLRPQCTIATPYPGTEFYDIAKKEGWLRGKIEDLEQTTASIEYPELSKEQLEEWHKKFYVEVVLHPRRLLKRLLRIKHVREVRNIPMHLKEFGAGMLGRMKYVR